MELSFKKSKRMSAPLHVVDAINNAIKEGQLKVGDRLPNEQEMCVLLDVGRSSLREGFRILAANGVLEVQQGNGTYITDRFADKVFEYFGFSGSREDFLYLLDLRRVMECGCVFSLQNKINADDCTELYNLARALDENKTTNDNISYDILFHEKLFLLTGNYLTRQMYRMMSKSLFSMMQKLMNHSDVVIDARDSHIKIVEGLMGNEAFTAVSAMKEHLDKVEGYLTMYLL